MINIIGSLAFRVLSYFPLVARTLLPPPFLVAWPLLEELFSLRLPLVVYVCPKCPSMDCVLRF